jgi:hypothetical protein
MISPSIQQQRAKILEEIGRIDSMIRGHLSQQTLHRKSSSGTASYGPYHILQRHENGTNNCQRIGDQELEFITQAVQGHARFQELTRRYAELTEQLTWDQQSAQVKKNSSASGGLLPPNVRVFKPALR